MADLFVSYARADKGRVEPLVAALEGEGWSVWWDPHVAPGQEFDRLIAEELAKARAVVVVWTPTSVISRWVRGEAREAADRGILAPVRFERAELPIDLRAIHASDLDDWAGAPSSPGFQELARALRTLMGEAAPTAEAAKGDASRPSICVLPFVNVGGDPEQEFFSDGISEDIITDLSKIQALAVASRNTAFSYKGKTLGVAQIARQLAVSHIVEGSVRKAGGRVRITAQLIEGASDKHIWAERYDRDLTDIFAVQDEITAAVVEALRVRLAPAEKKALGRRPTKDPEAYQLYLLARHYYTGQSIRRFDLIVRLCRRALERDPTYAAAWALIAKTECFRFAFSPEGGEDGWASAEKALALDPTLADAYAVRARVLRDRGRLDEAEGEIATGLRLDPEAPDVNAQAGMLAMARGRFAEAADFFEIASAADEAETGWPTLLLQCRDALGDAAAAAAAAREVVSRVEKAALSPDAGTALAFGASALFALGETERARAWAERAILLEPDDALMRYNLACTLVRIGDIDYALELLEASLMSAGPGNVRWARTDTDLDPLRADPRFAAMMQRAEARIGEGPNSVAPA